MDVKTKTITRDKEGHYIMIKESIQEEDIKIVNIYAPNIGAPQYIRQMLTAIKGKINSNTIIVGDFNIPMTSMGRSSRQKINKGTVALNESLGQLDLISTGHSIQNSRMHILFKCTWSILQDRSHACQYKSQQI